MQPPRYPNARTPAAHNFIQNPDISPSCTHPRCIELHPCIRPNTSVAYLPLGGVREQSHEVVGEHKGARVHGVLAPARPARARGEVVLRVERAVINHHLLLMAKA